MSLSPVSSGDPHVAAHNAERDAINNNEIAINARIVSPPNPKVGDLLRFNGTSWTSSATRLFEGTGQPEGVVAAPIGSRYVDTAATGGAVEWLKRSGSATSNTGWVLLFGDTGFRNVAGLINKRGSAVVNSAVLRRYGDVVDLYLDLEMPNNTTSPWDALTLPVGFTPPVLRFGALQDNKEGASNGTSVFASGVVNLYQLTAGKRDRYQGTWTTKDVWPSSLPGTAL